jgi:DNA-binding transcriptional LysR family regulator
MNLYHLRYFVTLAHLEHYTKAAKELNTTQPNLSYAVSALESELGITLFEKDGRNIVLTKCGKEFLIDAEKSLAILDSSIQKMQRVGQGDGIIEIGFLRTLGIDYIPMTLSNYLKTLTKAKVSFHFHDGVSGDLITKLKNKHCDIIFCSQVKNEPDIIFYPIATQDLVLIVPKNHPLSSKRSIDLSETLPYPQIYFHPRSGLRPIVDNLFHKINATPKIAMEIEEDQVIAGFVAAEFGIAIVPNMLVLKHLPVEVITIKNPSWERRFYMAYLKDQYQTPAVTSFIEFVQQLSGENSFLN